MNRADVSTEEVGSWEIIESPYNQLPLSPTQSENPDPVMPESPTQTGNLELGNTMIRDDSNNERSVFPTNDHEGLQIAREELDPSSSSTSSDSSDQRDLYVQRDEIKRRLRNYICDSSRRVASTIWSFIFCRERIWSFTWVFASVAVFVASSVYAKMLKRRKIVQDQNRNLLHMIKEKDQRINQLQMQIAEMNEMLSTKRRALVEQVGSVSHFFSRNYIYKSINIKTLISHGSI